MSDMDSDSDSNTQVPDINTVYPHCGFVSENIALNTVCCASSLNQFLFSLPLQQNTSSEEDSGSSQSDDEEEERGSSQRAAGHTIELDHTDLNLRHKHKPLKRWVV